MITLQSCENSNRFLIYQSFVTLDGSEDYVLRNPFNSDPLTLSVIDFTALKNTYLIEVTFDDLPENYKGHSDLIITRDDVVIYKEKVYIK